MLIFDENSQPIVIDNLYAPLVSHHLWVLDLAMMDYTLAPFMILEEITCSSITLQVMGFDFTLPSSWFVLVYDEETTQIDVVQVSDLAGAEFTALLYGPKQNKAQPAKITVMDYHNQYRNIGPSLNKHQMLCHPVSPGSWINVSSTDVYNKYLKDMALADIL
jgi:hypothetical protein